MPSPIIATWRPCACELPHAIQLLLGQQFGFDVRDAGFARHDLGGAAAVAGEHDAVLDVEFVEAGGGFDDAFAQTVAQQDSAGQPVAVGDQDGGGAQAVGDIEDGLHVGNAGFGEEAGVAGADLPVAERAFDASAGNHVGSLRVVDRDHASRCLVDDDAGERVIGGFLGGRGEREQFASRRGIVAAATMLTISNRPSVMVPVLSKTTVSILAASCMMEAPRTRMPRRASPPMAATMAVGVARIRAQGQATIRTATVRSQSRVK